MAGMHFHFVCNMNKFARLFIYIFILAASGAVEFKPKQSSTTTTSKEPSSTTNWKPSSTTRWKHPSSTTSWKASTPSWQAPSSTTTKKETTTTTRWKQPSTKILWKYSTTTKATPTTRVTSQAPVNHGVVAVASISGIDSRNGRYSSMNGIKIFPLAGSSMVKTDDKGNFIFKSVDGKMPMPITITKHGDGVSGTIRILPGSVSVSSSASSSSKSGPASAVASYNPWPSSYMKPIMNDIYFPPFPTFPSIPDPIFDSRIPDNTFQTFPDPFPKMSFHKPSYQTRIQDPWFNKGDHDPWMNKASFRSSPPKDDLFKTNWFYPTFNPFIHYW